VPNFPDLGLELWIAIVSSALAIISFGFNVRLIARQERREKAALRLQKDGDLIAWANDAIQALGRVQGLLRDRARLIDQQAFAKQRSECRTELSVIADRGRLFFPGEILSDADEGTAYSDNANPVVKALEDALRLLKDINLDDHAYSRDDVMALVEIRRSFVDRVFAAVDPRRRAQEWEKIG
jgi:hypothetical protein